MLYARVRSREKFIKTHNVIYARAKFNLRKQKEGETAEEYVRAITTLAKNCKYGSLEDELIRDKLVVGIRDQKLPENLQLDEHLTLEKTIIKIMQTERIKSENTELREERYQVDRLQKPIQGSIDRTSERRRYKQNETVRKKCFRCGDKNGHKRECCPANTQTCHKCKITGHFAAQCKTKKGRQIKEVKEECSKRSTDDEESSGSEYEVKREFRRVIRVNRIERDQPWEVELRINYKPIVFKIDTGADETILSHKTYKNKLGATYELKPTNATLVGPGSSKDGCQLKVFGKVMLSVQWKDKTKLIKCFVADTNENLLGRPSLNKLKIVKWHKDE
ncbi:uncharacterized protein [Onthophagus taurus]|uniref:uncharacterized protein n=1 Tax=Onthophagus taurus TaxID=166361 RepID=UPI0039BEC19C